MSQPRRTLAIIEASERSKRTRLKVFTAYEDEHFVYRDGELHEYTRGVVKRLVIR